MGKAGRNETKRVAANFLNGAAVAMLAAGCVGPALTQNADFATFVVAVLASAILHGMALWVAGDVED